MSPASPLGHGWFRWVPATKPGGATDRRRLLFRFQTDFETSLILYPFLEPCLIDFGSHVGGPFSIILAPQSRPKTEPVLGSTLVGVPDDFAFVLEPILDAISSPKRYPKRARTLGTYDYNGFRVVNRLQTRLFDDKC